MLLEAPFDLASAIVQEGFYVRRRVLSADPGPLASVSRVPEYGRAVPIDVPSPLEVEKDREANTQLIERAMSPVFLSTLEGGRKVRGLDGIPDARPMLVSGVEHSRCGQVPTENGHHACVLW